MAEKSKPVFISISILVLAALCAQVQKRFRLPSHSPTLIGNPRLYLICDWSIRCAFWRILGKLVRKEFAL